MTEMRELTDAELDMVSGGQFTMLLNPPGGPSGFDHSRELPEAAFDGIRTAMNNSGGVVSIS